MLNFVKKTQFLSLLVCFFLWIACGSDGNSQPEEDSQAVSSLPTDPTQIEGEGQAPVAEDPDFVPRGLTMTDRAVQTGPEQLIRTHLPALQGKRIGIVANHTSRVFDGTHLVDTLLGKGVKVVRVFAPEHGFRGSADAGQKIESGTDPQTGLPIFSLYGKYRKPPAEQLKDLDVMIFDIQDIGTRHYTYISTMAYAMEACAEQGIPFWVLDRPNPNGWYTDGPMMESGFTSFIGLNEVPIVHGMTVGEYAHMLNGEGWLANGVQADLTVIKSTGYTHSMRWAETGLTWIPPSPNIATEYAAYLYPALCWFESTSMSIGRGTDSAFIVLGAPWFQMAATARQAGETLFFYGLEMKPIQFQPRSLPGKSTHPKFEDELCQGGIFLNRVEGRALFLAGLQLLQAGYEQDQQSGNKEAYFGRNLSRWAGNERLQLQIAQGDSPEAIYDSWQAQTDAFRSIRKKYLLYEE